jgi:CHAT domain-containing protein/tetratricopeptide (TPR) repeat protein
MKLHSGIPFFTLKSGHGPITLHVLFFLLISSNAVGVLAQSCVPYSLEGTSAASCEGKVIDLGVERSPLEQSLPPGKTKCYGMSVQEGQFARVVIHQSGDNVGTTLYGPEPERETLLVVDTPIPASTEGTEAVSWVAKTSGVHTLVVLSAPNSDADGTYSLEWEVPRAPTADDQLRQRTDRGLVEAGLLYVGQGSSCLTDSIEKYKSTLPALERLKAAKELAETYRFLGLLSLRAEDYRNGLEFLDQEIYWRGQTGEKHKVGSAWQIKGIIFSRLGAKSYAEKAYEQALKIFAEEKHACGQADSLINIGNIYKIWSKNQKRAVDYYQQAEPFIAQCHDAQKRRLVIRQNMTDMYVRQKRYAEALASAEEGLKLLPDPSQFLKQGSQANPDILGLLTLFYSSKSTALRHLGRKREALEDLEQLLELERARDGQLGEATALVAYGDFYADEGDKKRAQDYYQRAIATYRAYGYIQAVADTLLNLALTLRDQGLLFDAKAAAEEAIELSEKYRVSLERPELRSTYLDANFDLYEFYIELLMELERLYPQQGYSELAFQTSERARGRRLLELLIGARVPITGDITDELRGKVRSAREALDKALSRRKDVLNDKFRTQDQLLQSDREVQSSLREYEAVLEEVWARAPKEAEVLHPRALSVDGARALLDGQTALVEFAVGERKSFVWVLTKNAFRAGVLPGRAEIASYVGALKKQLTARACFKSKEEPDEVRNRIAKGDAAYPAGAAWLSQKLLGPVASAFDGITRLAIVADDALQIAPLAVLPDPTYVRKRGGVDIPPPPLLAGYEIVLLPSATTLSQIRKEIEDRAPAPRLMAVFADPVFSVNDCRYRKPARQCAGDTSELIAENRFPARGGLPAYAAWQSLSNEADEDECLPETNAYPRLTRTRVEADDIYKMQGDAGERVESLDFDANIFNAMRQDVGLYRYIHFATHGYFPSSEPEKSGVVLSLFDRNKKPINGYLGLAEVYNLKLRSDVVTLSACHTGRGQVVKGEGMIGVARGFMYAGAPRVVSTLWEIDDESPAWFMRQFYDGLLNKHLPAAAALRRAQLRMLIQDPQTPGPKPKREWKNPYYWAGYTLTGEWR